MARKRRSAYSADEFYENARMYHRYYIRDMPRFLDNGTIGTVRQLSLSQIDGYPHEDLLPVAGASPAEEAAHRRRVLEAAYYEYDTLRSSLKVQGVWRRSEFEEYEARHEAPAKHLIVRLANTDVANPLRVFRFRVFRWLAGDRDVYLVCTKQEVADHFLKRLGRDRPQWMVQYPVVDLKRMTDDGAGIVLNGTFADMQGRPNLSSTTLSGFMVNQDAAWIDASKDGKLKTAIVEHKLENATIRMMVTNRGSIMIYGVDDITAQLALVTQAYEQVVKKYQLPDLETLTPTRSPVGVMSSRV